MGNFEQYINQESQENPYISLKKKLLRKEISLIEIRNQLLKMDQKTPTHEAAESNLEFLKDPDIVEFVNSQPDALDNYKRFLSFTEFHIAQLHASENNTDALGHFRSALDSSLDQNWSAYIQGTILYIQGKEIPEELILGTENEKNIQVLRNLNAGLKSRGNPSYREDYMSLPKQ